MPKSSCDPTLKMTMSRWLVYGRKLPTEENPNPEVICTSVFGKNEVYAKSQFWKINREMHKLKRAAGEVQKVTKVEEKNTKTVKSYGIYFHYRDRTGFRNAFKEFRDVSLRGAMTQLVNEMAGREKIHRQSIQVIKTCVLGKNDIKKRDPRCARFANSCGLAFPHWNQRVRATDRSHRSKLAASRPVTLRSGNSVSA